MDAKKIPRHTTTQVASVLARSESTVRHAASLNNIGTVINPRLRLFSDMDIDLLKTILHDGPGRPRKPSD